MIPVASDSPLFPSPAGSSRDAVSSSLSSAMSSHPLLLSCATACDTAHTSRLSSHTQLATARVTHCVDSVVSTINTAVRNVMREAKKRQGTADKALEMWGEELGDYVKMLECADQQLATAADGSVGDDDWMSVEDTIRTVAAVIGQASPFPVSSAAVDCCTASGVVSMAASLSRIQLGVDTSRSIVSVPKYLRSGTVASVSIQCLYSDGEAVSGLSAEAVAVCWVSRSSAELSESGWVINETRVEGNVVTVSISAASGASGTAELRCA